MPGVPSSQGSLGCSKAFELPPGVTPVQLTAWNSSGSRMAALDQAGQAQVWEKLPPSVGSDTADWGCSASWRAHERKITGAAWAPAEFGDVLATCSQDGDVGLWDELLQGEDGEEGWGLAIRLRHTSRPILAVRFGRSGHDLKLITASADGQLRVYGGSDPMDMTKWQQEAEFSVAATSPAFDETGGGLSSISIGWSPTSGDGEPATMAIGCSGSSLPDGNTTKIWEYNDEYRRWHVIAELAEPGGVASPAVHDVAWAPRMGRMWDLVAVADDNGVAIWRLSYSSDDSNGGRPVVSRVATLDALRGKALQVEWDAWGSTLATVGEDGKVRLFKVGFSGQWTPVVVFLGSRS